MFHTEKTENRISCFWKRLRVLTICVAALFVLSACGNNTRGIDVTTIVLHEDGTLTHVVVEDFSADYYDLDALKQLVEEEVSAYNTRLAEDRVKVSECKKNGDNVRLVMTYAAAEDYAAFNNVVFSYEKDGTEITVSEPLQVRTVKKITEVSDGVEIVSDRQASVGEDASFPATIKTEE